VHFSPRPNGVELQGSRSTNPWRAGASFSSDRHAASAFRDVRFASKADIRRLSHYGKSNFLHAIRLCIDAGLSSAYRSLIPTDIHSTVDISEPSQVLESLLRSSKVP